MWSGMPICFAKVRLRALHSLLMSTQVISAPFALARRCAEPPSSAEVQDSGRGIEGGTGSGYQVLEDNDRIHERSDIGV